MTSRTAFLILIVASVLVASGPAKAPVVAEKAPDFTLTDIDGNTFTLSDHRGKVVLIDFTMTSCHHNEQMHENLRTVRARFSEEELLIVSIFIGTGDTEDDIRDFRTQYGGNWIYAKDMQNLTDSYRISGVPTEFVVDVNGYIHYKHLGTTTVGVLSDAIEEARTGYSPPEIPVALIVIVIMIVVVTITAVLIALFGNRGRQR